MEKVIEFLKSLVVPRKMAKYRYMSVLLSIIIFMVSVYLLSVPVSNHLTNSIPEMKQQYNYLALQQIETHLADNETNETVLKEFSSLGCTVNKGVIECANLAENEVFKKEIVINVDGITKKIIFKVDLNLEEVTFDDILLDIKDYPYVSNEELYLVLVLPQVLFFQAHQKGIDAEEVLHNNEKIFSEYRSYDYQNFMPELKLVGDEANFRSLGGVIVDNLILSDVKALNSQIFTYLFLIMFILPIIFVFIFWLVFKRNGKLHTYKEYYNIAAIASILPVILIFIVSWFWRSAFEYYMYAFSLFYLFSLYKINNSPDEVL